MRITMFLMLAGTLHLSAGSYGQIKVSLHMKNSTMKEVLGELEKVTDYTFFYRTIALKDQQRIDVNVEEKDFIQVLEEILSPLGLAFRIDDKVVIITKTETGPQDKKGITITGKVTDSQNVPLPGVTIRLKDTLLGTATNEKGEFSISIPAMDHIVLIFSFIGYETKEITIKDNKPLTVVMVEKIIEMEEVVKTGYANIRKSSFTGSSTQVKRDELLKVSPGNVIDALQVFDPSLRILKNNLMGSDPNTLPEFYLRGQSGFGAVKELDQLEATDVSRYALTTNPNLPVFIMDGFEVSMEKVYDYDPNRIESITILKDAAATAIYGSRASNGVIVIETVAPLPGRLRVSYSATGSVTAPDLTDYNLANAKEKLEIEVEAGLLNKEAPFGVNPLAGRVADFRLKQGNILRGVDTYWLSKPLRTEFNHKHSLFIDGGVESIRFGLGLRYENQNGIMKESYRNRIGAELKVDYRIKGLQISNQASFDIVNAQNSPYGSFGDYTKQQPYFIPFDENGRPIKTFPSTIGNASPANPLFDPIMTESFNRNSYREFTDNLSVNWYIIPHLQLKGQFAISLKEEKGEQFIDPNSSKYASTMLTWFQKGELFLNDISTYGWNTNILLIYNNTFNNHHINTSFGFNAKEEKSSYTSYQYKGFPGPGQYDAKYAYEMIGLPGRQDNHKRLAGLFFSSNYTFNNIYLADLSVRWDGSSEFGSKKRMATFWSGGVGLNIHNYSFMKGNTILPMLRLKANYGQTGKVNFPPFASRHTYEIMTDDWHATGIGAALYYLGNDNLKWEKTNTLNLAVDFAVGKWGTFEFAWYDKRTVDLITDVSIPFSSGFSTYKDNLGEVQNRGMELNIDLTIIQNPDWNLNLFAYMSHNKNKILKISNSLQEYNDRVDTYFEDYYEGVINPTTLNDRFSKPIMKYVEGGSMESIFGMRSMGISPANGKELFMNKDGSVTYEWNSSQQVIIGNSEPDLQGSFGLNARYKNLTLYTTFLFETGGDLYNQTLVDQVENVNLWARNVDRRVYQDRWKNPGDMVVFKSIKERYQTTRSTSRFIQKNNVLTFNSLSVGYEFGNRLLQPIGLSMLKLQFNMKDVAVISSVKRERGLNYPFARTFNLSLNATF